MSEHRHCCEGCEKPQPFKFMDLWFCGRCWFKFGELVRCLECTPEVCGELK